MKALQKNAPFGENTFGIQKSYKVHKHRVKNMRKCIDNETPKSFVGHAGPRSPNRKVVAKQMAEENLRRENFLLAQRIFKIMQGESEITQTINDNEHIENHPGTMNFRRRLEEAQRIHHKNLMFAIRMQSIQPYYRHTDLSIVHATKSPDSPNSKSKHQKKTKFMKEFEYSLQVAEEQTSSIEETAGPFQSFAGEEGNQSSPQKGDTHGFSSTKRPRTILLQYTKGQDNRILDVVVLKEPFRDRYAIFGLDVDDGQRYELRLTSEDVSNILDGDILVTSVDNVEVWMALLNKVRLKPVATFDQVPFTNQEIDLLSANGMAFDFPTPYLSSASGLDPATKSMTSTPNPYGGEFPPLANSSSNGQRPQSRAPQSRGQSYTMPNPDEFDNLPFDYGQDNGDVPLSSRTETSGEGNRPSTSSRQARTPQSQHMGHTAHTPLVMDDFLESDAETAEMIRASNAAAALAAEQQQQATKSTAEAPALTPRQPSSRPSSKPASGRVASARTTTAASTNAAGTVSTTSSNSTPAAGAVRPVPPSKPKTPTAAVGGGNSTQPTAPRPNHSRGAVSRPRSVDQESSSDANVVPVAAASSSTDNAVLASTSHASMQASSRNTSSQSKKRPEEQAQLAQTVAAQMTQEKLVTLPSKLPEGLDELIVTPAQRVATAELVGIVSGVTSDAMGLAVSSVADSVPSATVSSVAPSVPIDAPVTLASTSKSSVIEARSSQDANDEPRRATPATAAVTTSSAAAATVATTTADVASVESPRRDSGEYEEDIFEVPDQSTIASPVPQSASQKKPVELVANKDDEIAEEIPDESS